MSLFRFFVDKTEQKLLRIRRGASEETPNGSGNPAIVTITRTRYLRFIETGRAVTTIADQPSDVVKSWRIPSTDYASVSFYKESGSNPETPWRYSWIWSNKEDIVRSFFKYHPEICNLIDAPPPAANHPDCPGPAVVLIPFDGYADHMESMSSTERKE